MRRFLAGTIGHGHRHPGHHGVRGIPRSTNANGHEQADNPNHPLRRRTSLRCQRSHHHPRPTRRRRRLGLRTHRLHQHRHHPLLPLRLPRRLPGHRLPTNPLGPEAEPDSTSATPQPVTLASADASHATLRYSQAGNYECDRTPAQYLLIHPPNQSTSVTMPFTAEACVKPAYLLLHVDYIKPGKQN